MPVKSRVSIFWPNVLLLTSCVAALAADEPSSPQAAGLQVGKEVFGKMPDGTTVERYTLTNSHGMRVKLTPRGATILSVEVPDREGRATNVTLGPDDFQRYLAGRDPIGALIGRYANRIAKAHFAIDGVDYNLTRNNGEHHMHGGKVGFDQVLWKDAPVRGTDSVGVTLTYLSRDGEEGYPGNLATTVTYSINENNELRMACEATTDKPTCVNLTNHAGWDLAGQSADNVLKHEVTIYADRYVPVDDDKIPLGEIKPVKDTAFDFTRPTAIGARTGPLHGIWDHCYVINKGPGKDLALAARVTEPASGRVMEVYTTQPGLQFYTGNPRAYCLEGQHYPDSPNQPSFPSTLLRPGQKFSEVTVYKFSVQKP
jgi:aldose 1-epimerase